MRCPRCGSGAGPDDRWCVTCGTGLPRTPPDAAPPVPPPEWPDGSPADPRWHPIEERARWATVACAVAALVWAAQGAGDAVRLATLAAAESAPSAAAADRVRTAGTWQDALAVAGLIAAGAALVAGVRWLDRAYRNLPALGARELRVTPGWATWAWLVPGLNAVRPKAVVDDVWRASTPSLPARPGPGWRAVQAGGLVNAWWATVLAAAVLAVVAAVIRAGDCTTPGELVAGARLEVAASVLGAVAWALSAVVVRTLTARQEERVRVLTGGPVAAAGAVVGARAGAGRRAVAGGAGADAGGAGGASGPTVAGPVRARPPVAASRRGAPWWPAPR